MQEQDSAIVLRDSDSLSSIPKKYETIAQDTEVNRNPHLANLIIYEKIDKVKQEIGYVKNNKTVKTSKGVTYSYPSIDMLEAIIQPLLRKHKLSYNFHSYVDPKVDPKEPWMIGIVEVYDLETGHKIEQKYSFPLADSEFVTSIQNYGSTITYARRYVYIQFFNIQHGDEEPDVVSDIMQVETETLNWFIGSMLPVLMKGIPTRDIAINEHQIKKTVHSLLTGKIEKELVIKKWKEKGIELSNNIYKENE